jgi:hypothetical protein
MTSFWERMKLTEGMPRSAVGSVPSIANEQPYVDLADATDGAPPKPTIRTDAATLFPFYDASTAAKSASSVLTKPARFDDLPTSQDLLADFVDWHTAFQLEYLEKHGSGSPKRLILGGSAWSYGTTLTAVMSSDRSRVNLVETMSRFDLLGLGKDDQAAIASTDAFKDATNGAAVRFNLAPIGGQGADAVRTDLKAQCDTYSSGFVTAGSTMTDEQVGYFKDGVALIKATIEEKAIFDLAQVKSQLEDIKKRYALAHGFSFSSQETKDEATGRFGNVISLDGGASLAKSAAVLIENEKAILDLNRRIRTMLTDNDTKTKGRMSAPALIASVQFLVNMRKSFEVKSLTEEINQQRALIEAYVAMQKVVNNTSAKLGTSLTDTKVAQDTDPLSDVSGYSQLGDDAKRVINMFDDGSPSVAHPMETLNSWRRPTFDMINDSGAVTLKAYKKSIWDGFGSNLIDQIQIISDDTQLKTSRLNKTESERNKHSDLATRANGRMMETILDVLSAGDV